MNVHSFFCIFVPSKKLNENESNFLGDCEHPFSSVNDGRRHPAFMESRVLSPVCAILFTFSVSHRLFVRCGRAAFGRGDFVFKSKIYQIWYFGNYDINGDFLTTSH